MMNDRSRRSAKTIISEMISSMLNRSNDPYVNIKLNVLETICMKMSWNDLLESLKYRHRQAFIQEDTKTEDAEGRPEKWFQK